MTEVQTFVDQYGAEKAALPGAELPWLAGLRERGIERFAALGFPTRNVEAWRYTNVRPLQKVAFVPAEPAEGVQIAVDRGAAHRLSFVNGRFRPDLSNVGDLPAGVELTSLAAVLADDPESLKDHLGAAAEDDGESFLALNTALMADGYVLRIGRGVVVEDPIEMLFIGAASDKSVAYHLRNLIVAEEGSAAVVVEDHIGHGEGAYFSNGATEVFAGPGARLKHYKLQDEAGAAFHLHGAFVRLDRDSAYESFVLSLGARLSRNEIRTALNGSGAECFLNGAYVVAGDQHVDNTTFIDHATPHTDSREVYKGVLDDTSRAVFQGTIMVRPDAQKINGHQLNRALLLSDKAEIDAKPALEIYADDVKCSHGATAGELDDDALFYLRARGIPEPQARRILIEAFLDDVIDEITHPTVRDAFRDKVSAWLAARHEEGK